MNTFNFKRNAESRLQQNTWLERGLHCKVLGCDRFIEVLGISGGKWAVVEKNPQPFIISVTL